MNMGLNYWELKDFTKRNNCDIINMVEIIKRHLMMGRIISTKKTYLSLSVFFIKNLEEGKNAKRNMERY